MKKKYLLEIVRIREREISQREKLQRKLKEKTQRENSEKRVSEKTEGENSYRRVRENYWRLIDG